MATGTEVFCKVNKRVNVKVCSCPNCTQLRLGRKKSIPEMILEVLADHEEHTKKELADATGLSEDPVDHDIGRAARKLAEDGHPVEILTGKGFGKVGRYRLVRESEAAAFWDDYRSRKRNWISPQEANELRERISGLEKDAEDLRKENKFLSDYNKECEAEIERLKHGHAAHPAASPPKETAAA